MNNIRNIFQVVHVEYILYNDDGEKNLKVWIVIDAGRGCRRGLGVEVSVVMGSSSSWG